MFFMSVGMLTEREFVLSEVCPDSHIIRKMRTRPRTRKSTSPGWGSLIDQWGTPTFLRDKRQVLGDMYTYIGNYQEVTALCICLCVCVSLCVLCVWACVSLCVLCICVCLCEFVCLCRYAHVHVCVWVYVHDMHTDSRGTQRRQISWNWNYEPLWASMWVVGPKPKSSIRAVSTVNHGAFSPAIMIFYESSLLASPATAASLSSLCLSCVSWRFTAGGVGFYIRQAKFKFPHEKSLEINRTRSFCR